MQKAARAVTQAIAALRENTSPHHTRVSSDTNALYYWISRIHSTRLSLKLKTTDSIAQPARHFTQDPFCDKRLENLSNYKFADYLVSGYE